MSKRRAGTGTRVCAHPGCTEVLPPHTGPGRPRTRCDVHRATRPHRKIDRPPPTLTVVPPAGEPDPEPPPPAPAPDPDPVYPPHPAALAPVVRRDLENVFSSHPAAASLTALASLLVDVLDHPLTRLDPRATASVSKELRATIGDLVQHEEAEDEDDLGGMPTPVGIPTA